MRCEAKFLIDEDSCQCVPQVWQECHFLYKSVCNQYAYDTQIGRDPTQNPFKNDSWYNMTLCKTKCSNEVYIDQLTCECNEPFLRRDILDGKPVIGGDNMLESLLTED